MTNLEKSRLQLFSFLRSIQRKEGDYMSDQNPWASMWTKPKQTIRSIVATNPKRGMIGLIFVYGLAMTLANTFPPIQRGQVTPLMGIIIAFILAPLIGVIGLYLNGWILWGVGKWFKGKAPFYHVFAAYAWSRLPLIFIAVMWFVLIVFGGVSLIEQLMKGPSGMFFLAVILISQIWAIVLLLQNLSEVQGFSLLRAFGNWIVAVIIVSALFFFLTTLIGVFRG
jgi:hypothetical protein